MRHLQRTHHQHYHQEYPLLESSLKGPAESNRQRQSDQVGKQIECRISVDEGELVNAFGSRHQSHVPTGLHRYTAEGKDQQTDDIVQGNEDHDPVCHLAEPLFGAQAQVEQQDGRFDQPDSDNENVLSRKIILQ